MSDKRRQAIRSVPLSSVCAVIFLLIFLMPIVQASQCSTSITFAIADGKSLTFRLPNVSDKWFQKTQKKYSSICFSQIGGSAESPSTHILVVLSNSQAVFDGLFPVYRTETTTDTSSIAGSGLVTDYTGSLWAYAYKGTVTTTTTTTTQNNLPYTDTTSGYFANAYSEDGRLVAYAWRTATSRQGGDPANTVGYNLGSWLVSHNPKEKLLDDIVKRILGKD